MKKLKLQFDKQAIQEFLLQNVEKIGAGVVFLATLLILYTSLARTWADRFDRTPKQLEVAATNGKIDLEKTPPDPTGLEIKDYVSQAKRSRVPIAEQSYVQSNLWDKQLFEHRSLREEPRLFAVTSLRGTAESGAFRKALAPPAEPTPGGAPPPRGGRPPAGGRAGRAGMATEETVGQQWVVVTGLVPLEDQVAAYNETFRSAVGYDRSSDYPTYWGYWVQRAEVASPGAAVDWEKAQTIKSNEAVNRGRKDWALESPDVVSQEYLEDRLVFPLGPRVDRRWDASVAHEPEIPLMKVDLSRERAMMMDDPAQRRAMMQRERGPGLGGLRGRPRVGEASDPDDPFLDKNEVQVRPEPPESDRTPLEAKAPKYLLFRFFDFDAEPGKQYVYRVRLALRNPNRDQKPTVLKSADWAKKTVLETPWSEATVMISVPRNWDILAASVKAVRAGAEAKGQIVVTKFVKQRGVEASKEFSIVRGQVANYYSEPVRVPVYATGVGVEINRAPGARGRGGAATMPGDVIGTAPLTVDFVTEATALDLRGGDRLSRRGGSPLLSAGEILYMDPNGTLVVRNELDDAPVCEYYANLTKETRTETPGPAPKAAIGRGGPTAGAEGAAVKATAPSKGALDALAR